jgi:hypothetical protein
MCNDCIFWDTDRKGLSEECVCRRFSELNVMYNYTLPTDYCSYGEREEEENDLKGNKEGSAEDTKVREGAGE